MPSRDSRTVLNASRRRSAFPALVIVAMVAFSAIAALPAQALPRERPAASRSFQSFLQDVRGWLVSLWAGEGASIDPHGGPTSGAPVGHATTTGDEGMSIDPHG